MACDGVLINILRQTVKRHSELWIARIKQIRDLDLMVTDEIPSLEDYLFNCDRFIQINVRRNQHFADE